MKSGVCITLKSNDDPVPSKFMVSHDPCTNHHVYIAH